MREKCVTTVLQQTSQMYIRGMSTHCTCITHTSWFHNSCYSPNRSHIDVATLQLHKNKIYIFLSITNTLIILNTFSLLLLITSCSTYQPNSIVFLLRQRVQSRIYRLIQCQILARLVNRKKAKLTLAKYLNKENKCKETNCSKPNKSELSSPSKWSCSNSITAFHNIYYTICTKSDGIDMSTFCLSYIQSYKAPKHISSSISDTLKSKFISKDHTLPSFAHTDEDNSTVTFPLVN